MRGLDLAEGYFKAVGLPMLRLRFPTQCDRIAAGLVGDGSECFGFDDELSRDHDWGPGFCLWLTATDFDLLGLNLQEELRRLPPKFRGYGPRRASAWGEGRTGAFEIARFYETFIGWQNVPEDPEAWLQIPEESLAAATNGRVFRDPLGEFTAWRAALLDFYPNDVRLKKIASRCMTMAQAGQYNFQRAAKRGELFAASYSEIKFWADAISFVFLLNKKFKPYHKWMHRAVRDLPMLGTMVHDNINNAMGLTDYGEKTRLIESTCSLFAAELRRQGLSSAPGDYLLDHGPLVAEQIRHPGLRTRNVWVG